MKKILILFLLLDTVAFGLSAQLLEDTDRRLKNAKVKHQGFLFFGGKKKISKSEGVPFLKKKDVTPEYSTGSPFKAKDYHILPKFSSGNPFRGVKFNIAPRFSSPNPFKGLDHKVMPRYSENRNPFRGNRYRVSPRYSIGMPFRGQDYNISPRYSHTKLGLHKILLDKKLRVAPHYRKTSLWRGNAESVRLNIIIRQWDRFWAKLNGNLPVDKEVKDPGRKAKFDKKERVIWNN